MNKVILITGASKGIGLALTNNLLLQNFTVIGTCRSGEINSIQNKNFHSIQLDLSNPESIDKASKEIYKRFNKIDILINNAGIGPDLGALNPDLKSFNDTFSVNVMGTVFFTESIIERLHENSAILNISSKMGSITSCERIDSVAYRMSKSALNMYTKILSNRFKDTIKVISIHPGWVKTTITKDNLINARISANESAQRIMNVIQNLSNTPSYWDVEDDVELSW